MLENGAKSHKLAANVPTSQSTETNIGKKNRGVCPSLKESL